MYAGTDSHAELRRAAEQRSGVLHRRQFQALGVSRHVVSAHLAARRWQTAGPNVVLLQNAPPTRRQLMWVAVLDAGRPAALGSHTSLELAGFSAFAAEAVEIHLVVPRGARPTPLDGVTVHESRRLRVSDLVVSDGPPRTASARSAVDAAAWQRWPRFAAALLAAVVQQRICTPDQLEHVLATVGRVRHKAHMRAVLADIAGGAEALGEVDVARLCRRFGLVQPDRQVRRRDADGKQRFLDAEWRLPSGERVVLEVDGAHHLDVGHWQDDIRRQRGLVVGRLWVLRATTAEVRLEPEALARDLVAMGVPRTARARARAA